MVKPTQTPGPCKFHIDRGDGQCRYCGSDDVLNKCKCVTRWEGTERQRDDTNCPVHRGTGQWPYKVNECFIVYCCPLHAAAPALLEALEAANVPHTMPAVHKMTDVVAGCPGCMARAAIAQAKGESND